MATSPDDIALRHTLHERYLEPLLFTQGQSKAHHEILALCISVRPITGVTILLFAREFPDEENNQFIR